MISNEATLSNGQSHWITYPRFLWNALIRATDGSMMFYAWMTFLTAVALVGVNAWAQQMAQGMILTHLTDHVPWGLYIANFTFIVGLAAGAVMMVIPAYLYDNEEMHDLVIIGELLAVASIIMCLLFVTVDLGRPDRFWHMMPVVGRFNWPMSILTWDVIVLNVYLLLNLHICGYWLYIRFLGRKPDPKWYVPFVMISIVWAITIHVVTAFLYCGLGERPFWNTALMAPRFLASAFISGPVFIIMALHLIRWWFDLSIKEGPFRTLINIVRVTIPINLLILISEVFTEFYAGGAHVSNIEYLYFGLHGYNALVPWIWSSLGMMAVATFLFLLPRIHEYPGWLMFACVLAFASIWIEKGMGLIVPGFTPSSLHEIVEYLPSQLEWKVTAGIWAFGLMVYTVALKIAIPILKGEGIGGRR